MNGLSAKESLLPNKIAWEAKARKRVGRYNSGKEKQP